MNRIKKFFKKKIGHKYLPGKALWGILRIFMGWIFLWPFFDKLFGLGFATPVDKAWLTGTSPTAGFLKFGTHGPFGPMFQNLAGLGAVDWIFMTGLILIGLALVLGIAMKVASAAGSLLLFLMWLAVLPPEHNPFLDDHLVYIVVLIGLAVIKAGHYWGLGRWWSNTGLVKKHLILE